MKPWLSMSPVVFSGSPRLLLPWGSQTFAILRLRSPNPRRCIHKDNFSFVGRRAFGGSSSMYQLHGSREAERSPVESLASIPTPSTGKVNGPTPSNNFRPQPVSPGLHCPTCLGKFQPHSAQNKPAFGGWGITCWFPLVSNIPPLNQTDHGGAGGKEYDIRE